MTAIKSPAISRNASVSTPIIYHVQMKRRHSFFSQRLLQMCTDLHHFWYATLQVNTGRTCKFTTFMPPTSLTCWCIVDVSEIMPFTDEDKKHFVKILRKERNARVHQSSPPVMWPSITPDLNLVDYSIWGILQERVYRSRIHDVAKELKECLTPTLGVRNLRTPDSDSDSRTYCATYCSYTLNDDLKESLNSSNKSCTIVYKWGISMKLATKWHDDRTHLV